MRNVLVCRRTFICVLSLSILGAMAFVNGLDTSMAIATVALGLAGANAAESAIKARVEKKF